MKKLRVDKKVCRVKKVIKGEKKVVKGRKKVVSKLRVEKKVIKAEKKRHPMARPPPLFLLSPLGTCPRYLILQSAGA